jgi:hypothetical protein
VTADRGRAVHPDGGGLDGHSRGGGRSLGAGYAGVDGSGARSGRPPYSTFGHSHLPVGLRPSNDQRIAEFASMLTMSFTLFSVDLWSSTRPWGLMRRTGEDEPLAWTDVERESERAAGSGQRAAGSGQRAAASGTPGTTAISPLRNPATPINKTSPRSQHSPPHVRSMGQCPPPLPLSAPW